MMKAKEYAEKINSKNTSEEKTTEINNVRISLLNEIAELSKKRNVRNNAALRGVLKEICQKWNAICNRCENLKRDGFEDYLRENITNVNEVLDNKSIMSGKRFLEGIDKH